MEKTPRYTQRERNMVLGFAAQYKDVIENKRTDAESNRKKDEVWRQIAKEFNVRVYHQRSSKQLRQLYKNMKLLLKKDLCGEGKGNRTFMDLLNTLSQQESVAQYISEQLSPNGGIGSSGAYSVNGRPHKFDDDYDDSKNPFAHLAGVAYDSMDPDVIVIKSEDISDNDQSQNGGNADDMDDDDCLSSKDIPEVCLEEEDDEIFATDLRQSTPLPQTNSARQTFPGRSTPQQQQTASQQSQQQSQRSDPATVQSSGGIRVGSIGNLANLKALQNGNNPALSITPFPSGNNNGGCNGNANNSSGGGSGNVGANGSNRQQTSAEQQAAQQLLLNGLGLSAVHPKDPQMPTLQRVGHTNGVNPGNILSTANQLLLSLNGGYVPPPTLPVPHKNSNHNGSSAFHQQQHNTNSSGCSGCNGGGAAGAGCQNTQSRQNDYLVSLTIEECKRKIDLINAQIDLQNAQTEYWKTLTKKLDAHTGPNPLPAYLCPLPGNVNGLQTPASSS